MIKLIIMMYYDKFKIIVHHAYHFHHSSRLLEKSNRGDANKIIGVILIYAYI